MAKSRSKISKDDLACLATDYGMSVSIYGDTEAGFSVEAAIDQMYHSEGERGKCKNYRASEAAVFAKKYLEVLKSKGLSNLTAQNAGEITKDRDSYRLSFAVTQEVRPAGHRTPPQITADIVKAFKNTHDEIMSEIGEPEIHGLNGKPVGQEPKGFAAKHGGGKIGEFSRGF